MNAYRSAISVLNCLIVYEKTYLFVLTLLNMIENNRFNSFLAKLILGLLRICKSFFRANHFRYSTFGRLRHCTQSWFLIILWILGQRLYSHARLQQVLVPIVRVNSLQSALSISYFQSQVCCLLNSLFWLPRARVVLCWNGWLLVAHEIFNDKFKESLPFEVIFLRISLGYFGKGGCWRLKKLKLRFHCFIVTRIQLL